jgi:hypothetical protein
MTRISRKRLHERPQSRQFHAPTLKLLAATFMFLICQFAAAQSSGGGGGGSVSGWNWRAPLPQGNPLASVAYGNNTYVAVGSGGAVLDSPDGVHWFTASTPAPMSLTQVVFGGNQFVAVGKSGTIWVSSNGFIWTASASGTTVDLYRVAYGPSGFVAEGGVTPNNVLLSSQDGSSWSSIDISGIPTGPGTGLGSVAYGAGKYVVIVYLSYFDSSGNAFETLTSPDAINWTLQPVANPASHSGILLDRGLTFGGSTFVHAAIDTGGSPYVLSSTDAITWNWNPGPSNADGSSDYIKNVQFDPVASKFVALTGLNDPPPTPDLYQGLFTSQDGVTWTELQDLQGLPIDPIQIANGNYYGVTVLGEIYNSADGGLSWTLQTGAIQAWSLDGIVQAGGTTLLAIGTQEASAEGIALGSQTQALLLASPDNGQTWSNQTANVPFPTGNGETTIFNAVAYADGTAVIVGTESCSSEVSQVCPVLYTSADAVNWTRQDMSGMYADVNTFADVVFGGGMFVITGQAVAPACSSSSPCDPSVPFVVTSTDQGATWSYHAINSTTNGNNDNLDKIVYDGAQFVAISSSMNSDVLSSTDGLSWNVVNAWSASESYLSDIASYNGVHVALGFAYGQGPTPSPYMLTSTDLITWSAALAPDPAITSLTATPFGLLAGSTNAVWSSSDGVNWTRTTTPAVAPILRAVNISPLSRIGITNAGGILAITIPDQIFSNGFESQGGGIGL